MLSWKEYNKSGAGNPFWGLYNRATRLKRYQSYLKSEKEKMNTVTISPGTWTVCEGQTYAFNHTMKNSFACAKTCPTPEPIYPDWLGKQKEGNNPMNYATATVTAATTETQDQRKYLARRLDDIYYGLERPLFATFGLTDDEAPSTPKELKARIADGKFTIIGLPKDDEDEDEDDFFYGGWSRMIRWRDPAKKLDRDGYDAARKELKAEYQKALDTIKIDEPKAGLDAVKAFEAWVPAAGTKAI